MFSAYCKDSEYGRRELPEKECDVEMDCKLTKQDELTDGKTREELGVSGIIL